MDDPIDYLGIAKAVTRFQHPTLADVQNNDGYKPRCVDCLGPCHPKSREYRAMGRCPSCYRDLMPLQTVKKELLPCKT